MSNQVQLFLQRVRGELQRVFSARSGAVATLLYCLQLLHPRLQSQQLSQVLQWRTAEYLIKA